MSMSLINLSRSASPQQSNSAFTSIDSKVPQARESSGRFQQGSKRNKKPCLTKSTIPKPPVDAAIEVLSNIPDNETTTREDKLRQIAALHSKWKYEDVEKVVEGSELLGHQRQRCKDIGRIIFGFNLHKEQIDAIECLFYKQTDLLLLDKTGFGKSLIFQLLPLITPVPGVVLILMPLKLLQAEQSLMINRIPTSKAFVLNGKNNQKHIQKEAAKGGYTHIFTSPEIALFKQFKKHVLDDTEFTDRLCLLAIDEIHLVDQWAVVPATILRD